MSSEVWNKVYKSDSTFFGKEPSNFALLCFNHMKANNVKKVLELGSGHGRDTIFFATNGIENQSRVPIAAPSNPDSPTPASSHPAKTPVHVPPIYARRDES